MGNVEVDMELADTPPMAQEEALLAVSARRAFWWRALAVVVDLVVLSLIYALINFVFGVTHVTSGSPVPPPGGGIALWTSSTDVGWGWLTLIWLVYYTGLEGLFGATVGKWAFRLRVTDLAGRLPGFRSAALRNLVRLVDYLPVCYVVGGGVALLSPLRQRLGDHLAQTVVIPCEAATEPLLAPTKLRQRLTLVASVVVLWLAFSAGFFYFGRPPLVIQSMVNTRDEMFRDGVSTYTLSAPAWAGDTVTYEIDYVTERPVDTCHARLTLRWTLPNGWAPGFAEATCLSHTP
jgi:uncharacterized RDD family membrane protein YckC